jgi:oligopeptide transport system ATP-binding protein
MMHVNHLNVTFKSHGKKLRAVRDVSFSIQDGETVGIVGESGCGKSVTAKALVQLLPRHLTTVEGTIAYNGKNLLDLSEKQMQRVRGKEIGMIFQDPMTSLNPTMKIGDQIIEGYLRHHPHLSKKEAQAEAIEMLKLVNIPQPEQRAEQYPHSLSGGMRQRAMIALALASKPKLLIADEPTTALDVTIQAQILELMREIQQKMKMSILLITHDMSVIAGFCDRVLVMYGGKIVESATVHDLFAHPQHPYTQNLLKAIPRLDWNRDHPLVPIEGRPPDLDALPTGCAFCKRCSVVMPQCENEQPPLFSLSPNHHSSCWRNQA